MNAIEEADPVDPRQRRHARVLGAVVAGAFFALMGLCFVMFSTNGLPKDPKEWKRLQERRAAAEAEQAEREGRLPAVAPPPAPASTTEKDSTR